MYDQLLTLAHETRKLVLDGKFAAVMRTLNRFEHEANETFLGWGVPDEYLSSSDPKDLQSLMWRELLEVSEDGCPAVDCILRPCCPDCKKATPEDNGKEAYCGA